MYLFIYLSMYLFIYLKTNLGSLEAHPSLGHADDSYAVKTFYL